MTKSTEAPATPEISPEDARWIATLPRHMQSVAREHGRGLFELTINCAMATEALGVLQRHTLAQPPVNAQVGYLAKALNTIAGIALTARGWSDNDVARCRMDLDRAISLAGASGSALILPQREVH